MTEDDLPYDDRVLAGEYALGLMSMSEAAAFARRLNAEPALAALVRGWQEDFTSLTDDITPVAPPTRVWREVQGRLFGGDTGPRWLMAAIPTLLAASLAVLLFVVPPAGLVRPPADPLYHIDLASEDGTLLLAAGYDGDTGELYVIPYDAPDEGTVHELWIIAGGNAPVSMGLLPGDDPARIAVAPEVAAQFDGATLAISVEPPGGSPTGAPTGPVIATGGVQTL
ncbi:anti-sigma factor domain-containing protein [Maritimibacter sp. DP1N21-5]|uniref:anti-sigma factor n=1 Tax=Maritimibacter sp. DP1N21-5 TaxID=2836867 RepID=UPI001C460937|nr:anti-sigma factor [Maritimibacter sp. DP1N21-5]MBV7409388.1 anti-sigma factor [Maritimibacter sp. DP1N21-5]